MAATLSVVPLYVKSKLELLVSENSLLSRALRIPRTFVNMVCPSPSTFFLTSTNNSYAAWVFAKIWPKANRPVLTAKSVKKDEENQDRKDDVELLRDFDTQKTSTSTITWLYLYILENNFLGITRESLELLRYESKVLKGLQDFEIVTVIKSLFGCEPSENETDVLCSQISTTSTPSSTEIVPKSSLLSWRGLIGTLLQNPIVSWILPFKMTTAQHESTSTASKTDSTTQHESTSTTTKADSTQNRNTEESCQSSAVLPTAGSLLVCESGLLPSVVSDSGTYALSATHDLLKEAVLLFVPMEILENTAELLKNPSLAISLSPMSVFWQLFNYISIWGLDVMDELCNQQEIHYAVIDDDDFHFVVNVPKLRRPIMFIGIR